MGHPWVQFSKKMGDYEFLFLERQIDEEFEHCWTLFTCEARQQDDNDTPPKVGKPPQPMTMELRLESLTPRTPSTSATST